MAAQSRAEVARGGCGCPGAGKAGGDGRVAIERQTTQERPEGEAACAQGRAVRPGTSVPPQEERCGRAGSATGRTR